MASSKQCTEDLTHRKMQALSLGQRKSSDRLRDFRQGHQTAPRQDALLLAWSQATARVLVSGLRRQVHPELTLPPPPEYSALVQRKPTLLTSLVPYIANVSHEATFT